MIGYFCPRRKSRQRGFTLIELLVVIVIIGVLLLWSALLAERTGEDRCSACTDRKFLVGVDNIN